MNIYYNIFPWQVGHQRRVNVSVYGLDAAFPGQIQPILLRLYRRISRIWHHWLGVLKAGEEPMNDSRVISREKRESSMDEDGQREESLPARKRRKVVDSATQTIPKKTSMSLNIAVEDSPLTKMLKRKIQEAEKMLRLRREALETRKRSRDLFNELGMST